MIIDNSLAIVDISDQQVLDIIKNRKIMKYKYLNDYQDYIKDILFSQNYYEKKRQKWIEQELRNRVPWYIKISNILGCIYSQDYIISLKEELEKMSYLTV